MGFEASIVPRGTSFHHLAERRFARSLEENLRRYRAAGALAAPDRGQCGEAGEALGQAV